MSENRELRAVLTVVDNFSKTFNDYNKKVSDATKSSKIPIYAEDKASATVKNITSKVDDLQRVANQPLQMTIMDGITSRIGMIGKQLDVLRAKAIIPVGMSNSLTAGALGGAVVGVAAMAAGIAMTIPAAASLEDAMVRIAKTTGMEGEAAKGVQKDMQAMMMATGKGLADISGAYELAGSAGIGSKLVDAGDLKGARKEIEGFVKVSMQMADAFAMPAEAASAAASGFATTLKPISMSLTDYLTKSGSAIDYAADKTTAKAKDILASMGKAGGALSFATSSEKNTKDMIALSTAIIATGRSGEDAGEAIKDFYRNAYANKEGKISDVLKMSKADYMAELAADPQKITDKVVAAYQKMKPENRGEFSKVFGDTGAQVLTLSLSENYKKAYADVQTGVGAAYDDGGRLAASYEKGMGGFNAMVGKIMQSVTVMAQTIGGIFLPGLTAILKVVNALFVPFVMLLGTIVDVATAIPGLNLVIAAAGMVAVATGVKLLGGALLAAAARMGIMTMATQVFTLYTNIAKLSLTAMGGALKAAFAFTMANPIVLVLALVVAIGYLLYKTGYLQKAWDKFKNSAIGKDLIGGIVAGVAWVTTAFNDLFTWLNKQWADMSSGAGTGLLGVLGSIMGALGGLFDKVDNAYKSGDLGKLAMNVAMAIFPPLMLIKPILMIFDVIKNTVVWLLEKLLVVFEWAVTLWKRAVSFLEWLWGGIKGMIGWLKDGLGITKAEKEKKLQTELDKTGAKWYGSKEDAGGSQWWKGEGFYLNGKKLDNPSLDKMKKDVDDAPGGIFGGLIKAINDLIWVLKNPVQAAKDAAAKPGEWAANKAKENAPEGDESWSDKPISAMSYIPSWDIGIGALGGMATGTDYVPQTGPYIMHKGERVIPASQNRGSGSNQISVSLGGIRIDKVSSDMDLNKLGALVERRALLAVKNALSQRRT